VSASLVASTPSVQHQIPVHCSKLHVRTTYQHSYTNVIWLGVEPVELEPIVLTITAAGDRAFLVAAARTWNSATACHLSILCVSLQSSPEDLSLLSVISRIIVKYRRSDI